MNKTALAILLISFPGAALAYIDPVSASMAIQALIAVVAGAIVAFRMYFRQAKNWVLRLFGKMPPPDPVDDLSPSNDEPREPK